MSSAESTPANVDHSLLEELLVDYIVPMFPGAEIERGPRQKGISQRFATLLNPQQILVRWPSKAGRQFRLLRSQVFEAADAELVNTIVKQWSEIKLKSDSLYRNDLATAAIRLSIAQTVARKHWKVVDTVIRKLEQWSDQTYEGRQIAAAFGIDITTLARGSVQITELLEEKFGLVMAHGLDSFLIIANNGQFAKYKSPAIDKGTMRVIAPLRFAQLAQWSSSGRVGLALTRNGEILVFRDESLVFARRRGTWRHFPHSAIISRAGLNRAINRELVTAAYLTALDVSFAKTGGGIGIITKQRIKAFTRSGTLNKKDSPDSKLIKGQFLKRLLRESTFSALDRKLRLELVAIDGSTVLNRKGTLLGAGAILKIGSGSKGGGREAAARTLGGYGLGMKISSDGEITGYATAKKKLVELFTVG